MNSLLLKKRLYYKYIVFLLLSLFLTACGGGGSTKSTSTSEAKATIDPSVIIADKGINLLSILPEDEGNTGKGSISFNDEIPSNWENGKIVFIPPSDEMPDGLFLRIEKITSNKAFEYSTPAIDEIFSDVKIKVDTPLKVGMIKNFRTNPSLLKSPTVLTKSGKSLVVVDGYDVLPNLGSFDFKVTGEEQSIVKEISVSLNGLKILEKKSNSGIGETKESLILSGHYKLQNPYMSFEFDKLLLSQLKGLKLKSVFNYETDQKINLSANLNASLNVARNAGKWECGSAVKATVAGGLVEMELRGANWKNDICLGYFRAVLSPVGVSFLTGSGNGGSVKVPLSLDIYLFLNAEMQIEAKSELTLTKQAKHRHYISIDTTKADVIDLSITELDKTTGGDPEWKTDLNGKMKGSLKANIGVAPAFNIAGIYPVVVRSYAGFLAEAEVLGEVGESGLDGCYDIGLKPLFGSTVDIGLSGKIKFDLPFGWGKTSYGEGYNYSYKSESDTNGMPYIARLNNCLKNEYTISPTASLWSGGKVKFTTEVKKENQTDTNILVQPNAVNWNVYKKSDHSLVASLVGDDGFKAEHFFLRGDYIVEMIVNVVDDSEKLRVFQEFSVYITPPKNLSADVFDNNTVKLKWVYDALLAPVGVISKFDICEAPTGFFSDPECNTGTMHHGVNVICDADYSCSTILELPYKEKYFFSVAESGVIDPMGFSEVLEVDLSKPNLSPIADAGQDKAVIEGSTVNLSATNSKDEDGSIASYEWVQISGVAVTMSDFSSDSPSFTAPQVTSDTDLIFRLKVTDNDGVIATDTILIRIRNHIIEPNIISVNPATANTYVSINQTIIITGTNLTDNITLQLSDCPSATLLSGGTATRRVFQCTPQSEGTKSGTVTDSGKTLSFSIEVTAKPDSASTGEITSPAEGSTHTSDNLQITVTAADPDGLKKVALVFKQGGPSYPVCDDATATPCSGNQITKTVSVNPSDFGAEEGQITIGLWVKDETLQAAEAIDNVGVIWTPTPIITIASVTPSSSVYAGVAQDFVVTGTNLTDNITLQLSDCPSATLLSGGTATRRVFQCTPQSEGTKSGTVTDSGKTLSFSIEVTAKPDSASTGEITSPAEGSTHTSDNLQITVTAADPDGLKKVALVFKQGGPSYPVCDDATATPCSGNQITKTVSVNPSDFGAEEGQITIGLWVKDETTHIADSVDNVGVTWTPTPVITIASATPDTTHVYATIAQNIVITGTNLTDNISMTLADCPSPVLQTGGTATQRVFQCVPSSAGTKVGTITDGTTSYNFSVNVEAKPVFAAIGEISSPTAGSTFNTQTIQITLNATDQDGLKKVALVFKTNTAGYVVCENGTTTPCDGNTITKTITVDPSSYGASAGALEIGLWVHDDNAQDYQVTRVDSVAITWNPPATISAPQNVQATAGDSQATLTWDNVIGAISYDVCQATETITVPVNCATHQGGQLHLNQTSPVVLNSLTNDTEYFFVVIAKDSNGVEVASAVVSAVPIAPVQITGELNDTGIIKCGNQKGRLHIHNRNLLDCNTTEARFLPIPPGQDALYGRDSNPVTNTDADGYKGFSFTKIGSAGQEMPASSSIWSCVKDNVTGLMWEAKKRNPDLHQRNDKYTWYNTDSSSNGLGNGSLDAGGDTCIGYDASDESTYCNTQAYVNRVNSIGYCGFTDWRMPTIHELNSIVSYGHRLPAIDTSYFPRTNSNRPSGGNTAVYWSSTPHTHSNVISNDSARVQSFGFGTATIRKKDSSWFVRLVRSSQ